MTTSTEPPVVDVSPELKTAADAKQRGNDFFKTGEFNKAIIGYTEAIDNFEDYHDATYDLGIWIKGSFFIWQ